MKDSSLLMDAFALAWVTVIPLYTLVFLIDYLTR